MHNFQFNVLGVDISFKAQADPERIEQARAFIEEQYERLKNCGGQLSRDKLLVLLVLGVVDDLLQSQQQLDELEFRFSSLLKSIEEIG